MVGEVVIDSSDWPRAKDAYGLKPFMEGGSIGIVRSVGPERIKVAMSSGEVRSVEPVGFGDWAFQPGDEVAVGPDVFGKEQAHPAADSVSASPEVVHEVSSTITLQGTAVLVDSRRVVEQLARLAEVAPSAAWTYLVVHNRWTSKSRLWGVYSDADPLRGPNGVGISP